MDASMVALLVAVVGMLGTLTSPVISQRLAARTRAEEREVQRHEAVEARVLAREEAILQEKKSAYVAFNAAAGRYRAQLMSHLHAVHEKTLDEAERIVLSEARRTYLSALSEVQIVAPDEVLASAEEVMTHLSTAYDLIKALERGTPKPGGSFEAVRAALLSAWDVWHAMRRLMRIDLGLEPAALTGEALLRGQADPTAETVLPSSLRSQSTATPADGRSPTG